MNENESKNEVQIFNFNGSEVRIHKDEHGDPMFCLSDVCKVLGLDAPHKVKERLKPDGGNTIPVIDTLGRTQQAYFINEQNLYKTIFQSRKHEAEKFTDWVTGEVLPSIRKSGGYIAAKADETPEMIMARAIKLADETINRQKLQLEEKDKKIAEVNKQIEENKPKVVFAESIAVAKTSILVGEMAKLIKQSTGVEIGQNRFFDYLRDKGYLHSKGSQKNLPTQRSVNAGWFEVKEGTRINSEGVSVITRTPKITGKGQIYFVNLFAKESNKLPLM